MTTDERRDDWVGWSVWYYNDGRVEETRYADGTSSVSVLRPVTVDGWPVLRCECGASWQLDGRTTRIGKEHREHEIDIPVPVTVYPMPDGYDPCCYIDLADFTTPNPKPALT